MALEGAWNAYIFREGKTLVRGSDLVSGLTRGLLGFCSTTPQSSGTALVDLVLRAGELEGALLDADSSCAERAASITDAISNSLVAGTPLRAEDLALHARSLVAPENVTVTPPEGFTYYSLHPLDFADLVDKISPTSKHTAVIGIRSIGTTLSAIVQAAFRKQNVRAERITVRPIGHPYDRHTAFSADHLRWIAAMLSHRAHFFIVDEGPGMSGSSFLSVGDALLSAGVPRSSITFLGTRNPDPATLTAPNAATRWPAFSSFCTQSTVHIPSGAARFVAGGIWRADVYADPQQWPASWLQMERLKFFSAQNDLLFKFEGYGRFGQAVHDRSRRVAEGGFGPMPLRFDEGFGVYSMLWGTLLNVGCATPAVLGRIAEYCAYRTQAFRTSVPTNVELENMLCFNVKEEFGIELPSAFSDLRVVKPVIADGRMVPQKWLSVDGTLVKLDAAIHGDDHFFPGPTDIAWDLAGTIVEWELDPAAAHFFLESYRSSSGDDASERVTNYLLAYSIFRTAYSKMASASMQGSEEEARLICDYQRYRSNAQHHLGQSQKALRAITMVAGKTQESPQLRMA